MEQLTCLDVPFDDAALHEVDGLRITTMFHEDCGLCWYDMAFLPDCPAQAEQLQVGWLCRPLKPTADAKQVKKRRKRLMQPSSMSGGVDEASMLQGLGLPTSFGTTRVSRVAEISPAHPRLVLEQPEACAQLHAK